MELHTYSSLSSGFLEEYGSCMDRADIAIVYYSRHALQIKQLPDLSPDDISKAFKKDDIQVFNDSEKLARYLFSLNTDHTNLLMMSSGNFDGIDLKQLSQHFTGAKDE